VYAGEPHVIAVLEGDDRYAQALGAVEQARLELDTYREKIKVSDVGAEAWKRDVAARRAALDLARVELKRIPASRKAYSAMLPVSAEQWAEASREERTKIIEAAMDRDRLSRMVERVVVKPCGRGRRVPVEQRADVYLVGSEKPVSVAA